MDTFVGLLKNPMISQFIRQTDSCSRISRDTSSRVVHPAYRRSYRVAKRLLQTERLCARG